MTVTDMSGADQHTFDKRITAIEAAAEVDVARDVAIERMARAMWAADNPERIRDDYGVFDLDDYRRLASAALDAAPGGDDTALRDKAARWLHEQYGEHTQPNSQRVTSLLAALSSLAGDHTTPTGNEDTA